MFPVFRLARQAAFDPALLANDFQEWIAVFKENTNRCQKEVRTVPKSEIQFQVSARALWLAENSATTLSPTLSPTSSFSSILSSSSSTSSITSSYYSNEFFRVQPSLKGGLGAFAITEIAMGTVVMSEKPLFRATVAQQVEWRYKSLTKEEIKAYHSLHYWHKVDSDEIQGIFKTNRFETQGGECKYGIFLKSSRFNHACHPYATCTYRWHEDQSRLVFTALRDVAAGEEMTISYIGNSTTTTLLAENYGFWCDCPGCPPAKDAEDGAKMRARTTGSTQNHHRRVSGGVLYYKGGFTILEDSWKEN